MYCPALHCFVRGGDALLCCGDLFERKCIYSGCNGTKRTATQRRKVRGVKQREETSRERERERESKKEGTKERVKIEVDAGTLSLLSPLLVAPACEYDCGVSQWPSGSERRAGTQQRRFVGKFWKVLIV
mmetsp:Transcript_62216/g.129053  ORF Transcript_62216/g.129053 Transcript_62216/m.129053 type:complete len:129 (+) Transcript_62216:377-763(+)